MSHEQLTQLIQLGVVDLDDSIALCGGDRWFHVWGLEGAFEAVVINAYRRHLKPIQRMRNSIEGGWMSFIEFRDQRDGLLLGEPGVKESAWAARARPDLIKDSAGHELYAAAAIGAAMQTAAQSAAKTPPRPEPAEPEPARPAAVFAGNVNKILQGDWPEWADPHHLLAAARGSWLKLLAFALLLTAITDPFRPWIHLQWFVVAGGLGAIYSALRQLASSGAGRWWAGRFVACVLLTLYFTAFLLVTAKFEVRDRAGILARYPQVAQLQESVANTMRE